MFPTLRQQYSDNIQSQRAVILIHGVLNPRFAMQPLARMFHQAGFQTVNLCYNSWGRSIEQIVSELLPQVNDFHESLTQGASLDIVGHSLGSIITRQLLQQANLPKLRRVVMLAPPNRGSHVATRMPGWVGKLVPAIDQLADHPDSFVNRLPEDLPVECGVIASAPDFVIHEEATHLRGETDHTTAPGPHAALIFRRSVFNQTLHFLENGRFPTTHAVSNQN